MNKYSKTLLVISVIGETKTGILCTSMGAILTEGYKPIRESAEKGKYDRLKMFVFNYSRDNKITR